MPKVAISQKFAAQARCTSGVRKTDYFDTRLTGFLLEVRQTGGKTYYQRYRDDHGRERQYKIGSADILTLAEARKKARSIAAQVLLGEDPQRHRQELRAMPTLSSFVQTSYLPFAKDVKRSWKTDETLLRLHILPALGRSSLDEISQQMIAQLVRSSLDQGYALGTTNRIVILVRHIFNLARKWGVPGLETNPTAGLKLAPENCRERFLTTDEARRLQDALENDENQVAACAIKLLLLTGARRNEVLSARWDCVNWTRQTLLVPRSKSGKPRHIKLSNAAINLVRAVPRADGNPYIFASPMTGRPSTSLHFPWTRIRHRAALEGFRLHDLRHSFASFLVNNGHSIYVVQKLLGHSQIKTTQRYAHLSEETLSDATEAVAQSLAGVDPSPKP